MTAWHDSVSEKLMLEAQASQMRNTPTKPQMALSDIDPLETSRPSSGGTQSIGDSTMETSSIVGANNHFSQPSTSQKGRRPPPAKPFINTHASARRIASQQRSYPPAYDAPWSPLRRRSSMPPDNRAQNQHPSSWSRGHLMSSQYQLKFAPQQSQRVRPKSHARTPSTLSESSFTSDSSYTTSSASVSPVLGPAQMHQSSAQHGGDIRRSQSLGYFNPPPGQAIQSNALPTHPNLPPQRRPSAGIGAPASQGGDWNLNTDGVGERFAKPNERGLNVRWPDQNDRRGGDISRVNRSNTVKGPDIHARNARSVDGRKNEQERERQRRGQSVGVGIRESRYA